MTKSAYTLGYTRMVDGEPQVSSRWLATPMAALEAIAVDMTDGFGNIVEAWCYRWEGGERRERQWKLVIDSSALDEERIFIADRPNGPVVRWDEYIRD